MKILKTISKAEWVEITVSTLLSDLSSLEGPVNMLLSGGSTPGPIYKALDSRFSDFSKLQIGLVDERFVHTEDLNSNERLLRTCFSKRDKREYNIIGMVTNPENEAKNLRDIRSLYTPFKKRTDVVILGMGGDGHFASIFPNDPESEIAQKSAEIDIYSTEAPADPKRRISCSMELIANAHFIYLLISGEQKLNVLQDTDKNLPIHILLKRRSDVKIFYLNQ